MTDEDQKRQQTTKLPVWPTVVGPVAFALMWAAIAARLAGCL